MNKLEFKKLIKEAVKEVIADDFKEIIKESLIEILSTHTNNTPKKSPQVSIKEHMISPINLNSSPKFQSTGDPIKDILNETAKSFGNSDWKNFSNHTTDSLNNFNPGVNVNTATEGSSLPAGEVSLDQIMGLIK
jgi:hypothetical protein